MSGVQAGWFLPGDGDESIGPFTTQEVVERVLNGELDPEALCWAEGMPQWEPLSKLPEFDGVVPGPAELERRAPSTDELKLVDAASVPCPSNVPSSSDAVSPAALRLADYAEALWFLPGEGDSSLGPHSSEHIVALLEEGALDRATSCWMEGMPEWRPVGSIPVFQEVMERGAVLKFRRALAIGGLVAACLSALAVIPVFRLLLPDESCIHILWFIVVAGGAAALGFAGRKSATRTAAIALSAVTMLEAGGAYGYRRWQLHTADLARLEMKRKEEERQRKETELRIVQQRAEEEQVRAEAERERRARAEALERLEREQERIRVAASEKRYQKALEEGRQKLNDGDLDAAEEHYRLALGEKPGDRAALNGLDDVKVARPAAARKRYEKAMSEARQKLKDGDLNGAEEQFNRALVEKANDLDAQRGLEDVKGARLAASKKRYDDAMAAGRQQIEDKHFEAAQKNFNLALVEKPEDPEAKKGLAAALKGLADVEAAHQEKLAATETKVQEFRAALEKCQKEWKRLDGDREVEQHAVDSLRKSRIEVTRQMLDLLDGKKAASASAKNRVDDALEAYNAARKELNELKGAR